MGSASSSQRGGKATQSQTVLRESTNANTPKDTPQAANIAKDNLISTNIKQDLKKDVATSTENTSVTVTAIPWKAYTTTTNPITKTVDQAAITLSSAAVGIVSDVELRKLANAVSSSETPPTLEPTTFQHIKEASNREREASKQGNARDPKTSARPDKRSRRVRHKGKGKGKGKVEDLQGETENVPPPTTIRQNVQTRRRRARGTGRVELGNGPPPRRERGTNDAEVAKAMSVEDDKTMDNHALVDRTRNHGRSMSAKNQATRRPRSLADRAESVQGVVSLEILALPKADRFHDANAADGNSDRSVPAPLSPPTVTDENITTSSSPCEEKGIEGDVSTVQPLPSATRRRAKEYFQRRTRERSVDAARRHTRPPRRIQSATVTGQSTLSKILVPRSQLDLNAGAKASGIPSGTRRSASLSAAIPDHFVFDPAASPFTPNATSSPKQASPSSIAVQSFSSPTPLPSHGNRKVAPLTLPKLETTRRDSVLQLVPITSHGIQSTHGLAHTFTGAEQAQAHLQAEQMALMQLKAYYNWLAGNTPMAGVGMGVSAFEHMDMSGGGGGLSGGVVLGRPGQNQGRSKGQFRNTSGAYAHPKEHVVFSPSDHEASQSVLQRDGGQTGPEKEPEGEAQSTAQKWDGKWGLREAGVSGKEIGWSWGKAGANVRAT